MEKFALYLALLTIYENNCRQLHWKLSGKGFHTAHERFGTYYDQLGTFMDETAEQAITMNQSPVNVSDALKLVQESDIDAILINSAEDYCGKSANVAAYKMLTQLYNLATEILKDESLAEDVRDVFMGHAKWYRIEGLYKLGRALTHPDGPRHGGPGHHEEPPEATTDDDEEDDD